MNCCQFLGHFFHMNKCLCFITRESKMLFFRLHFPFLENQFQKVIHRLVFFSNLSWVLMIIFTLEYWGGKKRKENLSTECNILSFTRIFRENLRHYQTTLHKQPLIKKWKRITEISNNRYAMLNENHTGHFFLPIHRHTNILNLTKIWTFTNITFVLFLFFYTSIQLPVSWHISTEILHVS